MDGNLEAMLCRILLLLSLSAFVTAQGVGQACNIGVCDLGIDCGGWTQIGTGKKERKDKERERKEDYILLPSPVTYSEVVSRERRICESEGVWREKWSLSKVEREHCLSAKRRRREGKGEEGERGRVREEKERKGVARERLPREKKSVGRRRIQDNVCV